MNVGTELCSYSSFTKGLTLISCVEEKDSIVEISLTFHKDFYGKFQKRIEKFPDAMTLSMNGVASKITKIETPNDKDKNDSFQVVTELANSVFLNSSLKNLHFEDKASIGMLSMNPEKYLLNGTPVGTVTLAKSEIAPGHQFTEMFTFQCSESLFRKIQNLQYIGLNGSGFVIQKTESKDGCFFFSVHTGKETREKTIFNCTHIQVGAECTLSLPYTS